MKTAVQILLFSILLTWGMTSMAQNQAPKDSAKLKKIEFLNADYTEYDESLGINAMRIIGRVVLRHEGVYMYADSAYRYLDRNAFDAFGRIHIEQGDSVDLYGDSLVYDGDRGLATLMGRVRMMDPQVKLETTFITYDIKNKTAFYPDSATTRSKDNNVLKSGKGTYYVDRKEFVFTRNVTIENPDYNVKSDTLHFKTDSEIAFFHGPTVITSDKNVIYCETGWYDTKKDICAFSKNASMDAGAQNLKADSIYYERKTGYGLAKKNVILTDTVEKTVVMGHYAESFEKDDRFLVTDSVTLILTEGNDSLFLSADTLYAYKDSICDRILLAYHRVKFFRADFQGMCDSLVYIRGDSLVQMFYSPVLWNDSNQLTANFIRFEMAEGKMKSMDLVEASFIISREDSSKYNQISGVNMHGTFENNSLKKVDVFTDGITVYYPKDEKDGGYIGINRAQSRDISIYLEDKKIDRIVFISDPKGDLSPVEDVPADETFLPGFKWLENLRPLRIEDIYSEVLRGRQKNIPPAEPVQKPAGKKQKNPTQRL